MNTKPIVASYLLSVLAVPIVLHWHLLPAVFAGLAVHVLTVKLARRLPANWGGLAHTVALSVLAVAVILGLTGITLALWSFLHANGGLASLLSTVGDTLSRVRHALPEPAADVLPTSTEELREELAEMVLEHGEKLSAFGVAGIKTFAHVLLGMVVGGMTALHKFVEPHLWPPLASALHARAQALAISFDKVVLAQVKIAALNTLLTALYLAIILPLGGVRLPLLTVLIPLTFVVGLLPVVGNLISNTVIVLLSLGVSPGVALASLIFLIVIHKLEYFTNARIIGGQVHARAWELLCAMLAMEALFGIPGLVAAPVLYAWVKGELLARGMI